MFSNFNIISFLQAIFRRKFLLLCGVVVLIIYVSLSAYKKNSQNDVIVSYSVRIMKMPSKCVFLYSEPIAFIFEKYSNDPIFVKQHFEKFPFVKYNNAENLNFFLKRLIDKKKYFVKKDDKKDWLDIKISTSSQYVDSTDAFVNSVLEGINSNIEQEIKINADLFVNSVNSTIDSVSSNKLKDFDYKTLLEINQDKNLAINYINTSHKYYEILGNDKCVEKLSFSLIKSITLFVLGFFVLLIIIYVYDYFIMHFKELKDALKQ